MDSHTHMDRHTKSHTYRQTHRLTGIYDDKRTQIDASLALTEAKIPLAEAFTLIMSWLDSLKASKLSSGLGRDQTETAAEEAAQISSTRQGGKDWVLLL